VHAPDRRFDGDVGAFSCTSRPRKAKSGHRSRALGGYVKSSAAMPGAMMAMRSSAAPVISATLRAAAW